jgi:hypothetical protein
MPSLSKSSRVTLDRRRSVVKFFPRNPPAPTDCELDNEPPILNYSLTRVIRSNGTGRDREGNVFQGRSWLMLFSKAGSSQLRENHQWRVKTITGPSG